MDFYSIAIAPTLSDSVILKTDKTII